MTKATKFRRRINEALHTQQTTKASENAVNRSPKANELHKPWL